MTWAPRALASRANCSCLSSIEALSPVQVVWVMAARTIVTRVLGELVHVFVGLAGGVGELGRVDGPAGVVLDGQRAEILGLGRCACVVALHGLGVVKCGSGHAEL